MKKKNKRLKEDIRMMNSQRNDSEKDKLIEKGKRMTIKQNNGHAYNKKKNFLKHI